RGGPHMNRGLRMRKTPTMLLALLAVVLLAALPAQQAFAAAGDPATDPTASQYNNPGSTVTDNEGDQEDQGQLVAVTPSAGDSGGGSEGASVASLPFTGFDVGVLAIVALLLGATGIA